MVGKHVLVASFLFATLSALGRGVQAVPQLTAPATLSSEFRKREDFETNELLQAQIQKVYTSIKKQGFVPTRHELESSNSIGGRTDIFVQTKEGKICRSFHDNFSDLSGDVFSVKCL